MIVMYLLYYVCQMEQAGKAAALDFSCDAVPRRAEGRPRSPEWKCAGAGAVSEGGWKGGTRVNQYVGKESTDHDGRGVEMAWWSAGFSGSWR